MTTTIYFLRHGEVHNPKKILYGRLLRFKLAAAGCNKIIEAANYFKKVGVNYIYTSPLLRARQSAVIVGSKLKIKPKISVLLTEVNLIFAGVSLDEYHSSIQANLYSKANILRGQESIETIAERMMEFVRMIVTKHTGAKVLVVSHGDPIMILKAITSGVKFTYQFKKSNYLKTANWLTLEYKNNRYIWK